MLVRVLAIAERVAADHGKAERGGETLLLVGKGEPLADRAVVGGGGGKGLVSHALAEHQRGRPVVIGQFVVLSLIALPVRPVHPSGWVRIQPHFAVFEEVEL